MQVDCQVYVGPYIRVSRLTVGPTDEAKGEAPPDLAVSSPPDLAVPSMACHIPDCQHLSSAVQQLYIELDLFSHLIPPDLYRLVHLGATSCYLPPPQPGNPAEEHGTWYTGAPREFPAAQFDVQQTAIKRLEQEHDESITILRTMHPEAAVVYGVVLLPLTVKPFIGIH